MSPDGPISQNVSIGPAFGCNQEQFAKTLSLNSFSAPLLLFCPHIDGAMKIMNDGVDCVGTGTDDNGNNDYVYGDLVGDNGDPVNDNGDNDDIFGDLVDDNGELVGDNGELSVSFQSTHPQVDSTTRLTAETSNLEKVSSEKSLIVILIVISSPSKSRILILMRTNFIAPCQEEFLTQN